MLAALDHWMARNPWHPRIVPLIVYISLLLPIDYARGLSLWTYPPLYVLQCAIMCWLLWRYRAMLPELNVRFHWGAVPVGVIALVAWIGLGWVMIRTFPVAFGSDGEPHYFEQMRTVSAWLYWTSLTLRLLGMSLVVPLFEELFVRSLLLRSFHRSRRVALGALQVLADMPLVGEWFETTKLGQRVIHREIALTSGGEDEGEDGDTSAGDTSGIFGREFAATPLGALSVCGIAASTAIFALHHVPRDWPGAVVCGILYCLLVGWTNGWGRDQGSGIRDQGLDIRHQTSNIKHSPSLGPVIWAHGVTNALLWAYCVYYGDWQFM